MHNTKSWNSRVQCTARARYSARAKSSVQRESTGVTDLRTLGEERFIPKQTLYTSLHDKHCVHTNKLCVKLQECKQDATEMQLY